MLAASHAARRRRVAQQTTPGPGIWLAALSLILIGLASSELSPQTEAAQADGRPTVILAHLAGSVDPITAKYVHRVTSAAADQRARLLVLTIDTPGGLDSAMRQMVQDLLNSPVPSVAYVSPSGARAASAGVFVGQAANVLAMAPGTNIGAAHPIQGGGEDIPADLRDKITNDAAAYIAGIAKQRGRNDTWVQEAVRQSVSLDADQAVEQHVADQLALDLPALLRAVDGLPVTTAAGPVTIQLAGATVDDQSMQPLELVAQKVFNPDIAYLLLIVGLFAVLIELFHPGALFPGVTGVVCLVLAFVGFATLPLNWGGVVLILAAAALFVLDVKATAHGALSVAGLVCLLLGSLLLYSPPGPRSPTLPDASVAPPVLVGAVAVGVLFSLLVVRVALGMAGRGPITGAQRLIGATGLAHTRLDPDGTVDVAGQVWSAHLRAGWIDAGQRIRVVGRTGLVLEIDPEPSEALAGPKRKEPPHEL
ncbi:MAG: nodulation protein NfeD [Chloroflexi bacterium]|nr:nodulation protein NfeD [Chloroflexota bacterium]